MKTKPILTEYVVEWLVPLKVLINFKEDLVSEEEVKTYLKSEYIFEAKKLAWVTTVYSCNYIEDSYSVVTST